VRLPAEFAKQLFSLTKPGDLVVIAQDNSLRALAIALAIAGMDRSTARAVGVTEPLPQIVFVPRGPQMPTGNAAEPAGEAVTAF
jgi:nucleotide-binding universal stress UspA family protein